MSTIVGQLGCGFSGDGGRVELASIKYPTSLALDLLGNIYFSDEGNSRIRMISTAGIINTIGGNGTTTYSGDGGPATNAGFWPRCVALDKHGNIFIADFGNNRIRKINTSGIITTFVGTGTPGFSGDGTPATSAQIWSPFDLAIDVVGNLYFPDVGNKRIRKIDTSGIITTIAGNGSGGISGDGIPATAAHIWPYKIAIDVMGDLYVADSDRIRKIDVTGIIHTIAGTGISGYNGDSILADTAELNNPSGIAVDACGSVYFGDVGNSRIRKVTQPSLLTHPTISLSGIVTAKAGTTVTITATVVNAGSSYIIHWMNHGIEFTTTIVPSVTYTKGAGIDTITARVASTATNGCYDSTTSAGHMVKTPEGVHSPGLSTGGEVTVYPNPVGDVLYIEGLLAPARYRLLNIVGVALREGVLGAGSNNISLKSLPAGVYVIEVRESENMERWVRKIIKE